MMRLGDGCWRAKSMPSLGSLARAWLSVPYRFGPTLKGSLESPQAQSDYPRRGMDFCQNLHRHCWHHRGMLHRPELARVPQTSEPGIPPAGRPVGAPFGNPSAQKNGPFTCSASTAKSSTSGVLESMPKTDGHSLQPRITSRRRPQFQQVEARYTRSLSGIPFLFAKYT
ncbi:hypothetical protein GE21DRAFT_1071439 [Neurospora crassa]|nr:hypothetical protein GE21DRAFT_1071439 [Neurospora crassa]